MRLPLLACLLFTLATPLSAPSSPNPAPHLILVVGAPGETSYAGEFQAQIDSWQHLASLAQARTTLIGAPSDPSDPSDLLLLQQTLSSESPTDPATLWLVFIGHGTFDGRDARFNLQGPDLTATNLQTWLQPFSRPLVLLQTASASAPFLPALAASNRVIVTATRSGYQQNATRFGTFLATAFSLPDADLDGDGQVSVLEAFLHASAQTADFYSSQGRLATEHALLDDNGDGLGTPADWFRGLLATRRPRDNAPLDGQRAHQFHLVPSPLEASLTPETRARRNQLEFDLAQLRSQRDTLSEDDYFQKLESLLLELARLYQLQAKE